MRKRCIYRLLGLLVVIFSAVVCYGRVFRRWQRSGANFPPEYLGGKKAYESTVKLNGGGGKLQVFAWAAPFGTVMAELREAWFAGENDYLHVAGRIGFGVVRTANRAIRVLAVALDEQCIVFRLDQSLDQFERSLRTPARHLLNGVPVYPGSVPTFFASNDETGTAFEMSSAGAAPATVRDFFEASFNTAGWMSPFPASASAANREGMSIYIRGRHICCLLVTASNAGRDSLIAILHKEVMI